jgi:hypothetical protein
MFRLIAQQTLNLRLKILIYPQVLWTDLLESSSFWQILCFKAYPGHEWEARRFALTVLHF